MLPGCYSSHTSYILLCEAVSFEAAFLLGGNERGVAEMKRVVLRETLWRALLRWCPFHF
nr:MAG TPA: hypothetical protein [Caudoviricetes sp.]